MSTATELLRRALDALHFDLSAKESAKVAEDIRDFLAPEPEADKPVAFIQPNHLDKAQFWPFLCRVEPKQRDDLIPLYTRPEPARKPMSDVEIADIYYSGTDIPEGHLFAFAEGFRKAERHHNIK